MINFIKNMSWVDSNSTTSTKVMNKEHEKFHLNSKLECFAQNIFILCIDDNIRFTVLKNYMVQLLSQDGTIIMISWLLSDPNTKNVVNDC